MKIGVLALQGAFAEHEKVLEQLGAECIELRQCADAAIIKRKITVWKRAVRMQRFRWNCLRTGKRMHRREARDEPAGDNQKEIFRLFAGRIA